MARQAVGLYHPGMRVEDIAERIARRHRLFHRKQRVACGLKQLLVPLGCLARKHRAHHWRMVVVENAGPFERQLVILVELAAPGLVSAKEGVGAGAYDEFIGGVVAAAGKYRTLHGSQYGCLVAGLLDE